MKRVLAGFVVRSGLTLGGVAAAAAGCEERAAPPPPPTVDLAPVEARLALVQERLDAMQAQQAELLDRLGELEHHDASRELLGHVVEAALVGGGLAQPGPAISPRQQRRIEHLFDAVRRFDGTFTAGGEAVAPGPFMLDLAIRLRTHGELILTAEEFIDQLARGNFAAVTRAGTREPLRSFLLAALRDYDRRP